MAIVKMSNFSLFTFDSDRDELLQELQKFSYVHFTNLKKDESLLEQGLSVLEIPKEIEEVDEDIKDVKYVIDLLKKYDDRETGLKGMIKGKNSFTFEELESKVNNFDYHPMIKKFRVLSERLDKLNQEEMKQKAISDELKPWKNLNYDVRSLKNFSFSSIFTGTVPKKLVEKLKKDMVELQKTYLEVISEGKDEAYILGITSRDEKDVFSEILRNNSYTNLSIPTETTVDEEYSIVKDKLSMLKEERKIAFDEIKGMKDYLSAFEETYDYLLNKKLRYAAEENFMRTENVNVISGFVPTDHVADFKKAVEKTQENVFYLEVTEADKDDESVPIMLNNGKFSESFESFTLMYSLPKYNGIDPTPLFAPFFFAFAGMMIGDLGYGIIMLIGTALALKYFNLDKGTRLFVRFLFYVSFSTMIWGGIFGSFFGGVIPMKALINPATEYQKLLILSIIFGGIHLFYALGIKAYINFRDGKPWSALFDTGFWYMALMGGIVLLLTMTMPLPAIAKTIATVVMAAGMVGIILTGGRDNSSVAGKLAGGLYSLYGISSYVGDFVSYSRLMALGLSGGFISVAINMMVSMLFAKGIIGIIFGVVVFIGGQAFNLFLSVLSAYVHTSRLTYVEFFGKFYEGGGKGFKLFRNKSKYINLE